MAEPLKQGIPGNVLVVLLLLLVSTLHAENWPRFRGPNGSGISPSKLPVAWNDDDYRWTASLTGVGNGSPVVWDRRVFLASADDDYRYLLCFAAGDGSLQWKKRFPHGGWDQHRLSTYANTTPALDADRVYVLWQGPDETTLHAFSHEGQPVWDRELPPFQFSFGTGVSPIVFDGKLVVPHDQNGESRLFAFAAETGDLLWKQPRSGRERDCFTTPCVYQVAGHRPQIVFSHCYYGLTGHAASTGEKLWQIQPFGTHSQRALASPVVHDDLVIATSGFVRGRRTLVAVRPGTDAPDGSPSSTADSDHASAEIVYESTRAVPYMPTPLAYRDRLFLWEDSGIISCVNVRTGEQVWRNRVRGEYYSSPVCADRRIYNVSRAGIVTVIDAADEFRKVGETDLGEETLATPAIADKTLFLRTRSKLFAISGESE